MHASRRQFLVQISAGALAIIAPEGTYTAFLGEGKMRLLATSGEGRSRFFPTVGTFAEQGARNLVVGEWFGLFAPAKTPAALGFWGPVVKSTGFNPLSA